MTTRRARLTGLGGLALLAVALPASAAEDWTPLWTTENLSQGRALLSATSAGNKVLFAGGYYPYSYCVDIYDRATDQWFTASLSQARAHLSATSAGGKVFFGGGQSSTGVYSNWVDIYDTTAAQWTTANLSQARQQLSATSADGKVFFGGGYYSGGNYSDRVDIYDTASGQWSTANLSQARCSLSATSATGKVFFAGGKSPEGYSDQVDIYDTATGQWSTASLSQARGYLSATSVGGKIFFGGGEIHSGVYSTRVDIYDTTTDQWSTANLSQARWGLSATSAGGKVFFGGGIFFEGYSDRVDIYDTATGQWSTASLSQGRTSLSATSAGNKVFFAGGYTGGYFPYSSVVDIYTLQNYGTITSTKNWTLVDNTTVDGRMQLNGGSLNLDGFDLTVGSMSGTAPITLNDRTLTVGGDGTSADYSGGISGAGKLTKTGAGLLTLWNTASWTGRTRVEGGLLSLVMGLGGAGQEVTIADGGELAIYGVLARPVVNDGIFSSIGGALRVNGTFTNQGLVRGLTGSAWLEFANNVTGAGRYTGNVRFSHCFSPGNSPAHVDLENVAFDATNVLLMEIGGLVAGSEYDQLHVSGLATLGGTLQLAFLNGYVPPNGAEFDLILGANTGQFSSVIGLEPGWRIDYWAEGVKLVIPEPATLGLLAVGGLGMLARTMRRRGKR